MSCNFPILFIFANELAKTDCTLGCTVFQNVYNDFKYSEYD